MLSELLHARKLARHLHQHDKQDFLRHGILHANLLDSEQPSVLWVVGHISAHHLLLKLERHNRLALASKLCHLRSEFCIVHGLEHKQAFVR